MVEKVMGGKTVLSVSWWSLALSSWNVFYLIDGAVKSKLSFQFTCHLASEIIYRVATTRLRLITTVAKPLN